MTQGPPDWSQAATPLVVVSRFVVAASAERADAGEDASVGAGFRDRARAALDALATQPGFLDGAVGRATDDPTRWVVTSSWDSVGSYRRALSAYEVKVTAVPLLSAAVDEPTAFEVLDGRGARHVTAVSALAPDAHEVRLGDLPR